MANEDDCDTLYTLLQQRVQHLPCNMIQRWLQAWQVLSEYTGSWTNPSPSRVQHCPTIESSSCPNIQPLLSGRYRQLQAIECGTSTIVAPAQHAAATLHAQALQLRLSKTTTASAPEWTPARLRQCTTRSAGKIQGGVPDPRSRSTSPLQSLMTRFCGKG